VIKEAVETKGWAIQFVENPSEEIQVLAVTKDYDAIKYRKNPSEEVQLAAINNYWGAIRYIENPSLEVRKKAVKEDEEAINYIYYDIDELKILISENINIVKYVYDSIDVENVVDILIDKVKTNKVDEKYINVFLELEILEMDKINFIREYGSKKAKILLVDYKLI
ncbi:hypothetical protein NQ663_20880, partial [Acinetobacter baumannii]|nr:hypothetical protein [Acinetobacter baumannii]